jgi:hypothetical protein
MSLVVDMARALAERRGRECNGDGTCMAARLHRARASCTACGDDSFDHETDAPDVAFCLSCGADAPELA